LQVTEGLTRHASPIERGTDSVPQSAAFDRAAALARVDGDPELLADLAKLFCDESPRMLLAIQEAIASKKPEALERAAHSLKGSVATFAAPGAVELALKLERIGRGNGLDDAERVFGLLVVEIARVKEALASVQEANDGQTLLAQQDDSPVSR
jgi:two-component system, sensor histidine kinase and response regulator